MRPQDTEAASGEYAEQGNEEQQMLSDIYEKILSANVFEGSYFHLTEDELALIRRAFGLTKQERTVV